MSSASEQEDFEVQNDSSEEDVPSDEAAGADGDTEDEDESVAGESEPEESAEEPALDASSTESDEDDEVDDKEDIPKPVKAKVGPSIAKITEQITEKFEKRQGRQLYIRFPEKLPESMEDFQAKVKSLSPLIVIGHKPRQKHARFCLVDFASSEDRDKTLKKLQKSKAETKLVASIPRTDSQEFMKTLAEKKLKQIEKRKAKILLKKERRRAQYEKEFTSTIVVLNIPKSASEAKIKELFPDAVDMQIRGASSKYEGTSIATITLPSPTDAKKNLKRSLTLGPNKLIIRFNTSFKKKNKKQNKKVAKNKSVKGEDIPEKEPNTQKPNGNKKEKNNKKKNKANGAESTEEQVIPSRKPKLPLSQKRETGDGVDSEVPQKKAKTVESVKTPQPKGKKAHKAKKGNQEGGNKVPQKKNGAEPKGEVQKQKKKKGGKKPVSG